MDLNSESVKKVLSKYKFRDVAIEELQKVSRLHSDMKLISGTYTSSDSLQKDLLKLLGNIPVRYQGHLYNLPILLWLLDSFPFTPPICFLRPTSSMVIREGKHVDSKGRIHLPGLHSWDHPKSSVNGLLAEMIAKFEEEPPLGTKSSAQGDNPNNLLAYVSNLTLNEGGNRLDQEVKVSVIGGGDLGIAVVLSIMAKSCVDKLVLIDIPESSTKGGTTDLEIFSLPKVEVSKVALWGNMGPGTDQLQALTPVSNSTKPLMDRALEMLKGRGQRSWSVGLSIADIIHSIVTDKKKIHSVTTLAEGWGGIGSKVFLSLPCVLGENGSTRLPGVALGSEDEMKLRESVACQVNLFMQLRL
ncbi:ubiquitin-conjugating enzyme E2 variant 3-like [Sinocyclocheilus rhinocerous]|uniref:ubiquitin-conjugating enzyme E2 variant 3-like n=1 Tax=Sinocyclocheilus rhinocerous TaxID=307959 RepID=UPI0007B82610|nr:PREDICTED: ubiquitin-conjugating enzyme E2 variant 3-like [Sinocyclocheilus rhinocerous]